MSIADLMADFQGEAVLPALQPAPPSPPPEPKQTPRGISMTAARRAKKAAIELKARQMEALRIYDPLPIIKRDLHDSTARIRLARGSNRAGKTLCAAVEVAMATTGQHPHEFWPKADGRFVVVGHTETQLAGVIFPKLFHPRPFNIIRDEKTGQWRTYNPNTDKHRESERRPAPPLIPKRFVKEIAWKDKKLGVPSLVRLTTGWTIHFFASGGIPPQGWDIDGFWIDEEVDRQAWYPELVARILDRKGRGIWSATPQVANPQLYELHLRAGEEIGKPNPLVTEAIVLLADNPYIEQEEKDLLEANLTDEERRVRIDGEFRLTGFRVYPEFSMKIQGMESDGFQVPHNWARFLVVDPGRQTCAALFAAVPPPGKGNDFVLLYDELYIKQSDAKKFAKGVASKTGAHVFERMLIDDHAARVNEMASGKNIKQQFLAALREEGVECRFGLNFLPGNDDVDAGLEAFRGWMRIREDGTTKLRVLKGRLPNFEKEIERYHHQRVMVKDELIVSDRPEKKNDHLMDCGRYLALFDPKWRKPQKAEKRKSPAVRVMEKKRKAERQRQSDEGGVIRLGPCRRSA